MKLLNRFRLPLFGSNPTSPDEGETWYDTATDQLKFKSAGTAPVMFSEGHRLANYTTGNWYPTQFGASTTGAITVSRGYAIPFSLGKAGTLSGISLELASAFATTVGTLRTAIYDDTGFRKPGNKLSEPATASATAGIKVFNPAVTLVLYPGTYWLVASVQGASGTAGTWRCPTGLHEYISDPGTSGVPGSALLGGNVNCFYSDTGFGSGVFPTSFGTTVGLATGPRFLVRFST
jgi:hypothetical protein